MRPDVPDWVLTESHEARLAVSSWRGGRLLAADVPVTDATVTWTADSNVPGRLTLTCPPTLAPTRAEDPLNIYGQRLALTQTLSVGPESWTVNLGWWLVQAVDHSAARVDVEALSLEQLILDWRFESPYTRPANATFVSTLRALAGGLLPVTVTGLTDRALPATLTDEWSEDRAGALADLAAAWPADIRVDDTGVLAATPARTAATPVRSWVHGEASAYVGIERAALRDDLFNAVVARGEDTDGNPVQAVVTDGNFASPTCYYGPFGRRPRFYSSPLLTTAAQAQSAAATMLARELRRTTSVVVDAPPDPRVQLLDTARVVDADGRDTLGLVTDITLPLTAGAGAATYRVAQGGL